MSLSLDGHTSFIGTEFIKLLNTGSSDLATEEYVNNAVAEGGGGGGNVDLSNYYTQTETDNLLNNKLNVNNPQDVFGNLRLDPTNGNSKIILNAVSPPNASDDFYCNGNGHFNGTLRVSVLTSDGDVNCDGVNADTFNSNVIANDIIFNHNDVEYMRFQVSDNTVRVPNTRSFLSQNIFTDIVKPLAFANDIVFNGKNATADGYEEYFKINSTDETVDFNKEIDVSENIVMKPNKFLYFDETSKVRYIRSSARSSPSVQNHLDIINEDGSQGRIRLLIGSNGSNTTDEQFLVDNTIISCKRNLRAGVGLETNTIDTIGSANLSFQRGGTEYLRFDTTDDNITCSKEIVAGNSIVVDTTKKLTIKPSLEGGVNIFDIRNLHPIADNPMIRYRVGEGGGETIVCEMTNNAVSLQRNVIVGTAYELRTNAIDTTNDNDLVISRNDVPFLTLDKSTEDTVEKEAIICSKQLRANANILVRNFQINQISVGIEYTDFRLENASNSIMRFFVGNSTSVNLQISQTATLNEILLNRATKCSNVFHTNTIDTFTDTDLLIKRSGTDVINIFSYTPTNGPSIIVDAQSDCGISSSWLFANTFANRTGNTDTEFRGAIAGGLSSGKVYMTYKHATETLDFDCSIDNTGRSVIGNILDTTVSDERLKTDIEDVDTDFTSCIKNVKVKTFKYKDDKYKTNDTYGMIAQDLLANLPNEFKNIVRENKVKDSDDKYLSINYMKINLLLWGALQETLTKVEHLEASVYELQEQLKDKKKQLSHSESSLGQSPKPTPKSKAKSKNVK